MSVERIFFIGMVGGEQLAICNWRCNLRAGHEVRLSKSRLRGKDRIRSIADQS